MSEPRPEYKQSKDGLCLRMDVRMLERTIAHDIDNFSDDMSPELITALKKAERSLREVFDLMK